LVDSLIAHYKEIEEFGDTARKLLDRGIELEEHLIYPRKSGLDRFLKIFKGYKHDLKVDMSEQLEGAVGSDAENVSPEPQDDSPLSDTTDNRPEENISLPPVPPIFYRSNRDIPSEEPLQPIPRPSVQITARRCSYCEARLDQILAIIKENHQQVIARLDSVDASNEKLVTIITTLTQISRGNIKKISKIQDSVESLERSISRLRSTSPKPGPSREQKVSESSPDTHDGERRVPDDPKLLAQVDSDRKKSLGDYYDSNLKNLKMTGLTREVFVNMWLSDKQVYMKKHYPDAKLHPTLFIALEKKCPRSSILPVPIKKNIQEPVSELLGFRKFFLLNSNAHVAANGECYWKTGRPNCKAVYYYPILSKDRE
jgi:hypothetical protein